MPQGCYGNYSYLTQDEIKNLARQTVRTHMNAIRLAFALDMLPDENIDRILVEEIQKVTQDIFPKVVKKQS